MPATPRAAGAKPAAPRLPEISVARFEEALKLAELMVAENTTIFIGHAQTYREEHRAATSRPLNAVEAVQVAAGVLDERSPEDRAAAFQAHEGLTAYDEPAPQEMLLAAGVATAPAMLHATLRVVALIELPEEAFEDAREAGTLTDTLNEKLEELRQLSLKAARLRAATALAHLAEEAGVEPGKAWGLVAGSVWQALTQAMTQVSPSNSSGLSSLTTSPVSTDGPDGPSSTTPATETQFA